MVMMTKEIGIGILGLGHVGRGTLDIIEKNQSFIEQEVSPYKITLIGLADLDVNRKPEFEKYDSIFTTSSQQVIEHPEAQIIVEAIGGEYPAYNLIKKALEAGKHVVTPNKEVVAKHGYELLRIAHQNQVQFLFETSVGSAIPILGVISNILTSCPLDEITGILNGTTNYILDLMFEKNLTQQEALKKAREMGYAEADPSKDILGLDALYKIFILSSLGFRTRLNLDQINYSGINDIAHEDIQLAKQLGYRIKLLAMASKQQDHLDIRIQPVLIDQDHLLTHIHGADNGIVLYGESYGELFFSGAGAGGIAGGSMIVSDIIRTIRQPQYFEYDYLLKDSKESEVRPFDQEENAYFLRIQLQKEQGCRDRIEKILAQNELTVERVSEMISRGSELNIGILTSLSREDRIKKIMSEIGQKLSGAKRMNCIKVYRSAR
jgi:homoserine dehydrogenase